MNDRLVDFLLRDEISRLEDKKKQVYEFIVKEEDCLALEAETADQFIQLLMKHSPLRLAAKHFGLDSTEIFRMMWDIELELTDRLEERYKKVQWFDFSDKTVDPKRKLYLFMN